MRLQLRLAVAAAVALGAASPALADGTLSMRGVYYKERATRVTQPMIDGAFEVGAKGLLTAHLLVDSITSASASSGAAEAAAFNEKRYEAGAGYAHQVLPNLKVGANGKYSTESDYKSAYVGARAELELAQKNLVLGLGGGVTQDEVSAGAAQGPSVPTLACEPGQSEPSCELSTYSLFASASQIVSRNSVVGITYDVSALRGFTANPYRLAIAGNQFVPENHPNERLRQAAAISFRQYLPRSETTLIGAYRFYRDDWEVRGHTPEVRIIQQVGDSADATFRYRFHTQTAAYFFRRRYAETMGIDGFVSDDVKLSAFRSHTIEAKLGVLGRMFGLEDRWARARFEGILQYVVQDNRFGNAIVAHLALTLPFEY